MLGELDPVESVDKEGISLISEYVRRIRSRGKRGQVRYFID
jgi:hypothetical protein